MTDVIKHTGFSNSNSERKQADKWKTQKQNRQTGKN